MPFKGVILHLVISIQPFKWGFFFKKKKIFSKIVIFHSLQIIKSTKLMLF